MEESGNTGRQRKRVVFVGAGNVATHLACAIDAGFDTRAGERVPGYAADVVAVWSRTRSHADALAARMRGAKGTDDIAELPRDADVYIISVVDDHIADVAARLGVVKGVVAHTSGSFPLAGLVKSSGSEHCGVFYPLQTFSKASAVDTVHVPMFIEGTDETTIDTLSRLADAVTDKVHRVDSTVRGHLHIAAVFANNFANYMWNVADRYLRENTNLDIHVFEPLLAETLRKAMALGPHNAQTGPARRGDLAVIERHIALLNADDAEVYRLVTEKIIKSDEKPDTV